MITKPIIPISIMIILSIVYLIIGTKNIRTFLKTLILVILLFLANLRILIPDETQKGMSDNLDILFVIDTTISMNAEDYNGTETRLSAVKKDCEYIINELAGSKYSIITFDNISQIRIPFTYDLNVANESINTLIPANSAYAIGSTLSLPINDIITQLTSSSKDETRKQIIFYISDGEITTDQKLGSFTKLKDYVDGGCVLGYGTENGGYMKRNDLLNRTNYIVNKTTREKEVSKINEKNLKQIAKDIGIEYIKMNQQENIQKSLNDIKEGIIFNDENEIKSYKETYYYFIIAFVFFIGLDYLILKRSI